jgi:hypothetical protein
LRCVILPQISAGKYSPLRLRIVATDLRGCCGTFCRTTEHCALSGNDQKRDLERRGVFKKLLRDEEAKLKKYEEDHKKEFNYQSN